MHVGGAWLVSLTFSVLPSGSLDYAIPCKLEHNYCTITADLHSNCKSNDLVIVV